MDRARYLAYSETEFVLSVSIGLAVQTDLTRIQPAHNAFRFYRLAVWPDLFGGYSVAREWGRIGSPGKLRLDCYESEEQALDALDRLVRAKHRRGYRAAA
jgi:predicted DNA-binding WGR domain protein